MNSSYKLRKAIAMLVGASALGPVATLAAVPPVGSVLSITGTGTTSGAWISGSYFAMDTNGNAKILDTEKFVLTQGPDGGIIIGRTQGTNGHQSHSGSPHPGVGGLDNEWGFFNNAGMHFTTTAITQLSATTVRMSGWTVTWNGIPAIAMGTGAWAHATGGTAATMHAGATGTFSNGVGNFTWDGTNGGAYTLDYRATVPANDPSGFGGVRYELHLEGTVSNSPPTAGNVNMAPVVQDSVNNSWTPNESDSNNGTPNTSLTCTIVTQPTSGGVATVANDCSSGTYTPASGYTGSDSFTYRVNDGLSNSTTNGTVSVAVVAVGANFPPQANDDSAAAATAVPVQIDLTGNDTDSDGTIDNTSVVATDPANGTVVDNDDGTVTYTSDAGFVGRDTFTYTVDDNVGDTSIPATVTVAVSGNFPVTSPGTTLQGGDYDTDDDGRADTTVPSDSALSTSCIGGCFDFVVTGVSGSVDVVLPLTEALPSGAGSRLVYRKYDPNTSTWRTFTATEGNSIKTAQGTGTDGTPAGCPAPGSSDNTGVTGYRSGLNVGDRCIQLTLVDNGAWDSNAVTGTVADPGGIGVFAAASPAPTGASGGGGGCTLSSQPVRITGAGDWLVALAGVLGLGLFRRRKA